VNDYSHLVGHRFPGGRHTLESYEAWLWDDAVEAGPNAGAAHPGSAYMIALHGGGASIQAIMDLLGTASDAGVMMAGVEFELAGPIEPGATFEVEGEVTAVERKVGRRAGAFDLVGFVHRLRLAEAEAGEPVAVVRHSWVIPRKEDQDGGA
jgi:hypothetical protein